LNVEEYIHHLSPGPKDYTLTYFGFNGRASAMCFMLQKAKASWEKKAITFPEWGELKKKQGGGLPVVTYKGKLYTESVPTANMIAKNLGFYPEDPLLAHRCDFTVAAFSDAINKLWDPKTAEDPAAIKKVIAEEFPKFLDKIEAGLGKMKWMAGDKLSVADFWVGAWWVDWVCNEKGAMFAEWPAVVKKYPNVCKWGEAFKWENRCWIAMRAQDLPY
jgi:glutathione S-transferase